MLGGIAGVVAIILFVTAHEGGHYLAAKAFNMKVTEFFLGFGPRLWSFRRGETEYGVKPILFGAYVRIVGMSPFEEVAPEDRGRTYRENPFWKKSVVVLAGVGANFLIAYLMFFGLVLSQGVVEPMPVVAGVLPEVAGEPTPASQADLRVGDRVVAVDGEALTDWAAIQDRLAAAPDQAVVITVERQGTTVDVPVTLTSRPDPETGAIVGFVGLEAALQERSAGFFEAGGLAAQQVGAAVLLTFQVLGEFIQPANLARLAGVFVGNTDLPDEIRPVSPIGLAAIGSQVDTLGVANYIALLASINIILATFNILPLPPLDGGHFAVALWQKITGREPDVRKLTPIALAVIVLFTFLGLVGILLDIVDPIRL